MKKLKQSITKSRKTKLKYDLDSQSAKISALLSGSFAKYEFLTGKDVLLEKNC